MLPTSSRRLPSARSATSCARNTSSSLPRCCGSGAGAAIAGGSVLPAEHSAPPRSHAISRLYPTSISSPSATMRSPRISWTRTSPSGSSLNVTLAARAAPEQRPAALEHDVEAEPERASVELRALVARDQRDAAIDAVRDAQDEDAVRAASKSSAHSSPRPNRPVPASGTRPTSGSPATDVPLRESRSRSVERRRSCARSRRAGATRRRRAASGRTADRGRARSSAPRTRRSAACRAAQLDLAGGEQRGVELVEHAAVLARLLGRARSRARARRARRRGGRRASSVS